MVEFAEPSAFEESRADHVPEAYREFRDGEGIPVHVGLAIEDVNDLETGPWNRTNQDGAFINLYGAEGVNDLQLHRIAPGEETTRQRHLYDALVYVSQGRGVTSLGREGEDVTFEWSENSHFFIPPNTPYRHANTSEDTHVHLLYQTPLPQLCNLVKDTAFLFECGYDFWDAFEGEYGSDGEIRDKGYTVAWDAYFIPDLLKFDELRDRPDRGAGGTNVHFPMGSSSMWSHISEFPAGTYKKAHRHAPGATVIVLSGEGYSVMWREGWDRAAAIEWGPGSLLTPPARWFHQHFNTSDGPARYAAMHAPDLGEVFDGPAFDPNRPANRIEYVDEDPAIRRNYEARLRERGLETAMPERCYTDPDFEF